MKSTKKTKDSFNVKLFNSLTKKVEQCKPLEVNTFRIYSCGPTVYDYAHIGNLSSFIFSDILKRSLKLAGFKVEHVMNFTDVDDKTISRSQQKYPELKPHLALKKLTNKYEELFLTDMINICNNVEDIKFVRATESIPEMQVLISVLYDSGFAYVSDDGIYFSIEAYQKSGKVYGQLTKLETNHSSKQRINNDEYSKNSVNDFALWKKAKPNEPKWNFKIDNQNLSGRPGWHIECSAMSTSSLGQPFDIHTGGIDLKFPHHENEIAQSTAGKSDKLYAKTFCHSEHLLVDSEKMSKSKNNFYTLKHLYNKGFSAIDFRFLILQSNYRNQTNFTWENLDLARKRLSGWFEIADRCWQLPQSELDISNLIIEQMNNDLNTPQVLSSIDEYFNDILARKKSPNSNTLLTIKNLLGIDIIRTDINSSQKLLLKQRSEARKEKNWQLSDQIREKLKSQGIEVNDTEDNCIWSRPLQ